MYNLSRTFRARRCISLGYLWAPLAFSMFGQIFIGLPFLLLQGTNPQTLLSKHRSRGIYAPRGWLIRSGATEDVMLAPGAARVFEVGKQLVCKFAAANCVDRKCGWASTFGVGFECSMSCEERTWAASFR